jgi:hypothetical protein
MKKYIFVFICLSILSCKKNADELYSEKFEREIKNLVLPSGAVSDSLFFTGSFNGSQVTISNNIDHYSVHGEFFNLFTPKGNLVIVGDTNDLKGIYLSLLFQYDNLSLSTSDDLYKPHISINSPLLDKHLSDENICDSVLTKGDKKIRSFGDSDTKGFEILLTFNCKYLNPGYNVIDCPSSSGYQTNDAKLLIDEVTKTDQGNKFVYLVKGRLTCKLFAAVSYNYPGRLVFDVKDGRFAQRIEAYK